MKIISRKEAIKKGLTRFYTGKLCANGHDSERYTLSYSCLQCNLESQERCREKIKKAMKDK